MSGAGQFTSWPNGFGWVYRLAHPNPGPLNWNFKRRNCVHKLALLDPGEVTAWPARVGRLGSRTSGDSMVREASLRWSEVPFAKGRKPAWKESSSHNAGGTRRAARKLRCRRYLLPDEQLTLWLPTLIAVFFGVHGFGKPARHYQSRRMPHMAWVVSPPELPKPGCPSVGSVTGGARGRQLSPWSPCR